MKCLAIAAELIPRVTERAEITKLKGAADDFYLNARWMSSLFIFDDADPELHRDSLLILYRISKPRLEPPQGKLKYWNF